MKRTGFLVASAILGGGALFAAGCASDTQCGDGTVEVDGACVPEDSSGVDCGTGTVEMNGECVPNGEVICENGTTYDAETGTCVADITGCEGGFIVVDGVCVDPASVDPDVSEGSEPNGFEAPVSVDLPAEGESTTLGGCIEPTSDLAEYDVFAVTTTGPTLVDIAVDGYGGLAGGFVVLSSLVELDEAGWERYGINLVGDTSQREVFLPSAGTYFIAITDSRSLVLGAPAGSPDACYLATLSQVAIPAATAVTDSANGMLDGTAHFYSFDPAEGDLLLSTTEAGGEAVLVDTVALGNQAYLGSSPGLVGRSPGDDAELLVAGFRDDDEVLLVVDPVLDYALDPTPFQLTLDAIAAPELPSDGSSATVDPPDNPLDANLFYFDAEAGDIVFLDITSDATDPFNLLLVSSESLNIVSELCNSCTEFGGDETGYLQLIESGRYYLAIVPTVDEPASFDLTVTRDSASPTPLTVGTVAEDLPVDDRGAAFVTITPGSFEWWTLTATPTDFDGTALGAIFPADEAGVIDVDVPLISELNLTNTVGQVFDGYGPLTIAVFDDGGNGDATVDVLVEDRDYQELVVDEANPSSSSITLDAGETDYFLVRVAPLAEATITATGVDAFDPVLSIIDALEASTETNDATGAGAAESTDVTGRLIPVSYHLFTVAESADAGGDYTFDVTVTDADYVVEAGNIAFSNICPDAGGSGDVVTVEATGDEPATDEGISASPIVLGFDFPLYNEAGVGMADVNTNGWLTLADPAGLTEYGPGTLGVADVPNATIAPMWADLSAATICSYVEADRVTVQWTGTEWWTAQTVQAQAIHHDDGVIDFVYGPGHTFVDGVGTVGLENSDGSEAFALCNPGDAAVCAPAESSWTFTPNFP